MPDPGETLLRLEDDGLVLRQGGEHRTTRRWQAAMARAATRLYGQGDPGNDLRVPIAVALVELYPEAPAEELAGCVEALLPIELAELDPRARLASVQGP